LIRSLLFALSALTLVQPAGAVTLNIAHLSHLETAFGAIDSLALSDCIEGLVTEDAGGNAIPGQAETWEISPDGLVYTFTLRQGIAWSDGTAVTAADFLAGFQWLFDPVNAAEFAYIHFPILYAEPIASGLMDMNELGVRVVDVRTLEITLERPTPYFLEILTHSGAFPLPSAKLAEYGPSWLDEGNVVCNGPYVIVGQEGEVTRSVKSETYYDRDTVAIDDVSYRLGKDADLMLDAFGRGEIDLFLNLPASADAWIEEHVEAQAVLTPALGVFFLALNLEKPPFDRLEVREALSMAIEREPLDLVGGEAHDFVAYGIVPQGVSNYEGIAPYRPEWADWPLGQRLSSAAAIMSSLGYPAETPLVVELRYSESLSTANQETARKIAEMWSRIGVRAELRGAEPIAHFGALRTGDFDIGRFGWILDYSDPHNVLELFTRNSDLNVGRYDNPDYDALIAAATEEIDLDKRAALLAEAERTVLEDGAIIPISWLTARNLVAPGIAGVEANAENVHLTRWLSKTSP
jgi:oligopeptide transport system substrate-binding protein